MLTAWSDNFLDLMHRGGPVMWVLLAMSVGALTMIFERAWFWFKTNNSGQLARVRRMEQMLRKGDWASAKVLAESDSSVYGRIIAMLALEGRGPAVVTAAVESQRLRLDRCMGMLTTMITAAPLVGLFGSVLGLIHLFSAQQAVAGDPRSVGQGLAEALLNTAGGLAVAVVTIFPYNAFRVQVDRTLGRIESILAAAGAVPRSGEVAPSADPG